MVELEDERIPGRLAGGERARGVRASGLGWDT